MKVTKYEIIGAVDIDALEKKIIEMLKQGWQPQGGVSGGGDAYYASYIQAMVKYG